jgi:hypothetical protein
MSDDRGSQTCRGRQIERVLDYFMHSVSKVASGLIQAACGSLRGGRCLCPGESWQADVKKRTFLASVFHIGNLEFTIGVTEALSM